MHTYKSVIGLLRNLNHCIKTGNLQNIPIRHDFSVVLVRQVHKSRSNASIFHLQPMVEDSDIPNVGQPLVTWHYTVLKHGKISIKSLMDVHVQAIDPQKYPQMNKLFINIMYVGEKQLDKTGMQDLMKQYIVGVDLGEDNQEIQLTIKQKLPRPLPTLCHVQVPMKYDIDMSCFKDGEASIEKMESENISMRTVDGNCILNNIKGLNIDARTAGGDVVCNKVVQGNVRLATRGQGKISGVRLQGQTISCQSEQGDVKVKAIYADRSWVQSRSGSADLASCHGNTQVNLEEGNLNIGSLDGDLTGRVVTGDTRLAMSREGNVHLESDTGDVHLSVPQSMDCGVKLEGTSVQPGHVTLHNQHIQHQGDTNILTGELRPQCSNQNLILASTKRGNVRLSYYDWLASININRGDM